MNPHWKKACWDVVSKESLKHWQEVAYAIANPPLTALDRLEQYLETLPPLPSSEPLDSKKLITLFGDYESWGDPQEEEFSDESWGLTGFLSKLMLAEGVRGSSMNQALDEDVDFSCAPESFVNMNDILKIK